MSFPLDEHVLRILMTYWQGGELESIEKQNTCRQLSQQVLRQVSSKVAQKIRAKPANYTKEVQLILAQLVHADPISRELYRQLLPPQPASPAPSVASVLTIEAQRDINIAGGLETLLRIPKFDGTGQHTKSPSPSIPLTLRMVPHGSATHITWEADVIGTETSIFHSPFSVALLPVIIKALDAVQWPEHPHHGPAFTPEEREQLKTLGLWSGNRVAVDIHQRVGQALYNALIADSRGAQALGTIRNHATAQGIPARYVFRFPADDVELAALPWELLWDAHGPIVLSRGKLASFERYLNLAQALPPTGSSRRVLRILALSPRAHMSDDIHEEEQIARANALKELVQEGSVVMEELSPVTPNNLVDRIQAGPPVDVVHFYGHGRYKNGQGELLFDTSSGGMIWVDAQRLAVLLGETRLILLHACQSAMAGPAGLLSGVGPALCAAGVPIVIAMQLTIRVTAATRFVEVFYRAMARGDSVQHAVSQARQALFVEESDGASWYVPSLTIRARDDGLVYLLK